MSRTTKILHVFNRMDRGGAEMRTIELFRQLDRRQYMLHFCSLSGLPGELDDEVRLLGGEVHLLRRNQASFPRRFRKLLREQQFDVVNSQVFYYSGVLLRMAAQCGVPIRIAQFQNTHDGRRRSLVRRVVCHVMRGLISRHATNILAVSEGAMNCAWREDWRSDQRCRVIYNGVGTSSFPTSADRVGVRREFGLSDDTPLCIHVGRFMEQKNHIRLPDIFSEVLKNSPDARLLLVGAGDNKIEQNVRRRIAKLGIEDRVIFAGRRSDVPRLFMAADVMLFPSLWEGLPGVVQEACIAGTPVVASDLPGVREIAAQLDGIQYLPLGAPDVQWAAAVSAILNSRWSHTSKEEARKKFAASPFAIDRVAQQYCSIWGRQGLGAGGWGLGIRDQRLERIQPQSPIPNPQSPAPSPQPLVPTKPISILHVHGRMGRGGAELRTVELLRRIDRRRYRFDFCALSGLGGELDEEIRRLGGEVYPMRTGSGDFAERFERLIREHQYDVVHSHLHYSSGYLLRTAARCGVPVRVAHFRSLSVQRSSKPVRRLAQRVLSPFVERFAGRHTMLRWVNRYATDILGVSCAALKKTFGPNWKSDPRCCVVYDGIEPARFAAVRDRNGVCGEFGLADDGPLFIHVGRMTEEKNHRRLISIFREVLRRRPQSQLLLVSRIAVSRNEIAIERSLRRRIEQLGLVDRVTFSGERTDVPRLMKAADVLIFPSNSEGLGDVVLEASAAGTPALCSNLPSICEIADRLPGVRCLPLGESDATWAELAAAMADDQPSEQLRSAALETFSDSVFTTQRCLASLCRIWNGDSQNETPPDCGPVGIAAVIPRVFPGTAVPGRLAGAKSGMAAQPAGGLAHG